MENAKKDSNNISTALGTSNADGVSTLRLRINPTMHYIEIEDGTSGSDLGPSNALHDENNVPAMMGVSNSDGITPVSAYINNSTKKLLVNSH